MRHRKRGFTIAEFSIVVVILALLVGFVITGKTIMRTNQINEISIEKDAFTAAVFAFRQKYSFLPGDFYNAYEYWRDVCGDNSAVASTGCNGNGNGVIESGNYIGEAVKVWEHLSRAGLIEGAYDGVGTLNETGATIMSITNAPKSKFKDGYWQLSDAFGDTSGGGATTPLYLIFGGIDPLKPSPLPTPNSLNRGESWDIDVKIDDGQANFGNVRGNALQGCNDNLGTRYGMSFDIKATDCTLTFILN